MKELAPIIKICNKDYATIADTLVFVMIDVNYAGQGKTFEVVKDSCDRMKGYFDQIEMMTLGVSALPPLDSPHTQGVYETLSVPPPYIPVNNPLIRSLFMLASGARENLIRDASSDLPGGIGFHALKRMNAHTKRGRAIISNIIEKSKNPEFVHSHPSVPPLPPINTGNLAPGGDQSQQG